MSKVDSQLLSGNNDCLSPAVPDSGMSKAVLDSGLSPAVVAGISAGGVLLVSAAAVIYSRRRRW